MLSPRLGLKKTQKRPVLARFIHTKPKKSTVPIGSTKMLIPKFLEMRPFSNRSMVQSDGRQYRERGGKYLIELPKLL